MFYERRDEIGFIMVLMMMIILAVLIRAFIKHKKEQLMRLREEQRIRAQQEENGVYNISSRVQGQPHQFPDAYLSVEHISISNELNKPPKYDDAPPSYEEAIKIAMAQSNSLQTFQAEQPNNTRPQPQSSTSTTTTTVVVPAVPSQTTE